jgi:hypothetical protein
LIEENSFIGQDIATQKQLFSYKYYTYFGEVGYAKTYDPSAEGITGSDLPPSNVHHCAGETNPHSIKEGGNSYTPSFKYLKENHGY